MLSPLIWTRMYRSVIVAVMALWLIGPAHAQETVRVTAVGSKIYTELSTYIKQSAIEDAKREALKKVAGKFPTAKKRMFKEMEESIFEAVDDFILEAAVQEDQNDAAAKTYKVAISALVDIDAINAFFIENSAAGNQEAGDASDFGALFVARVELGRQSYKTKVTDVKKSNSESVLNEESASDGTSSVDSTSTSSMTVEQSGGSSKKKRDKVEYEANSEISESVGYAVEEQLVNAGFEPMDGQDLADEFDLPYLEDIIDQNLLRKNGSFPKKLIKQYKNAAIDAGWTFLGMGTIDIGTSTVDEVRGGIQVPATVSFKVWMLTDGRAKTVASVRPKVIYGQDRNGDAGVAETNAYNEAVIYALDTVVAQLQQKGLR